MECATRDLRTAVATDGRPDRIIAHRFKTVHNETVESITRRRNGSQIARLAHSTGTPKVAFAWSA
eukprot:5603057-Lingulodinium_polyedra.AAC.1